MSRKFPCALAILNGVCLWGAGPTTSAQEVMVPGEPWAAMIGPSAIDSYAERLSTCSPPPSGPWVAPPSNGPGGPQSGTIQTGCDLSGSPPTLGFSFEGFIPSGDPIAMPPDTMGAVGPLHFMEVINGNVSIFLKDTGDRIASETLECFFSGIGMLSQADPRVLFDQHSNRWIVTATSFSSKTIGLAVSLGPDPTGAFFKTSFAVSTQPGEWADYPTLGVNVGGIFIAADMEDGTGGRNIWAIDKTPLIANSPSVGTITAWRVQNVGTCQPAHTYGTSSSEFINLQGKSVRAAYV